MAPPTSVCREDFQMKENSFTLPEQSREFDPFRKRALTICNLFVNHKMSIANIQQVLDEEVGRIVQTLIQGGILYDRRKRLERPPADVERRLYNAWQGSDLKGMATIKPFLKRFTP